ncbi:MAG TPA: cytochrome P450 [Candidatus Dormibacteraeota bacterium]
MAATVSALEIFSHAARPNPFPIYQHLREQAPVHYEPSINIWFLSRYEDASTLLKDGRFSADRTKAAQYEDLGRDIPRSILGLDPPDHTRLRGLVMKAFTPRVVEQLKPRIQKLVDDLLHEAAARGEFELVGDFAYPLPVTVIAEMMGVPVEDRERFQQWSRVLAASLDPIQPPERLEEFEPARIALTDFFKQIVAERRAEPRDDLISALVQAEERGDMFSETELLVMCNLLLIAGHETTVNLISNGTLAALRNPDQLERWRTGEVSDESAVEELLRFDGPVQLTGRIPTEEVEFGGRRIEPRTPVITLIGGVNRDPEAFQNPDQLDLGRHPNQHFAFGRGIHFCLGAPLARLEAQIALGSLVRTFPNLRLAGDPTWRDQVVLRGLETLPVAV